MQCTKIDSGYCDEKCWEYVFDHWCILCFCSLSEIYREQNDVDNTEANVEALLRMTELGKVGDKTAQKVIQILFQFQWDLSQMTSVKIL